MKSVLKNRNFLLIILGKFVSLFGNAIYDIGLMWYFLSEYGEKSGGVLAWIMVLGVLPSVLLGIVIGSIIDRFNKKYLMVAADLISGLIILIITLLMHYNAISNIYLLIATGLISLTTSFVSISVNSLIPELFTGEGLYPANAINQFIERGTLLAGFSAGGILVGIFGVEKLFLLNAVSFIVSALFEMFIVYTKIKDKQNNEIKINLVNDFKEIYEFVKGNRNLFRVTVIFSLVNFLWDPLLSIVYPYVLKNSFSVTSSQFGVLEAALPVGFCMGAIYFTNRKKYLENKHVLFYSILCVNTILMLISIPVFFSDIFTGKIYTVWLMFILLMLAGIFSAAINISTSVTIQACVPDSLTGKYLAFSMSITAGLVPIGALILGALLGKIPLYLMFGTPVLLVYCLIVFIPRNSYSVNLQVLKA